MSAVERRAPQRFARRLIVTLAGAMIAAATGCAMGRHLAISDAAFEGSAGPRLRVGAPAHHALAPQF